MGISVSEFFIIVGKNGSLHGVKYFETIFTRITIHVIKILGNVVAGGTDLGNGDSLLLLTISENKCAGSGREMFVLYSRAADCPVAYCFLARGVAAGDDKFIIVV